MNAAEKLKVMKVANWLIERLLFCGDVEFVDRVLTAVHDGATIDEGEMQDITMAQYCEDEENGID